MALIVAPGLKIRHIDWALVRPAQINTALTGKRKANTPWFGKWMAHVELAPLETNDARAIRSFFARCQGAVNTFKLYVPEPAQNANSGVTVSATAAAGTNTLSISGAATPMGLGQHITVNDQMLLLIGIAGSVLTFEPQLRMAATAGTPVETSTPYALVYLVSPETGWDIDLGPIYSIAFDVEEAF